MRHHILLGFQLRRQFRHRDVRLGLDPIEQRRHMRRKLAAPWGAALPRSLRRACSRHKIGKLHREARTDFVPAPPHAVSPLATDA